MELYEIQVEMMYRFEVEEVAAGICSRFAMVKSLFFFREKLQRGQQSDRPGTILEDWCPKHQQHS
jgi:hypothetical protein